MTHCLETITGTFTNQHPPPQPCKSSSWLRKDLISASLRVTKLSLHSARRCIAASAPCMCKHTSSPHCDWLLSLIIAHHRLYFDHTRLRGQERKKQDRNLMPAWCAWCWLSTRTHLGIFIHTTAFSTPKPCIHHCIPRKKNREAPSSTLKNRPFIHIPKPSAKLDEEQGRGCAHLQPGDISNDIA
jgi:hypothetical protein